MKFIYKLLLSCAAVFLIAIMIFVSPVSVMASEDETIVDGYDLPLYPTGIYGHHYLLVSAGDPKQFHLVIFDDISNVRSVNSQYQMESLGSSLQITGIRGVLYVYVYDTVEGWTEKSLSGHWTSGILSFNLQPIRIHRCTFDIPLSSNASSIAIQSNADIIEDVSNRKHLDGLSKLMFGAIGIYDSSYLGIMPLVCMITSAVVVFIHRMIGRGF